MDDAGSSRIPLALKIGYTAFMAVLVPVYWWNYGPTNFLYFCDVAAFLTIAALWLESPFLASMAAVGIVLPQLAWLVDLGLHFAGLKLTGMSGYMFDSKIPAFTRGLSLFHGWLPLLLLYVVWKLGYDRRALPAWIAIAWALMLICYFWMPRPGTVQANPKAPVNINYVYGFSDAEPQPWMPEWLWLSTLMIGLPSLIWWPTHLALSRLFARHRV
jgi:hypothetical protein